MHDVVVEMVVEQRASGALFAPKTLDFWLVDAYHNLAKIGFTFSVRVTRAALCDQHRAGSHNAPAAHGVLPDAVRREDSGAHEPRRADEAEGPGGTGGR